MQMFKFHLTVLLHRYISDAKVSQLSAQLRVSAGSQR